MLTKEYLETRPPRDGEKLDMSIDAKVALYYGDPEIIIKTTLFNAISIAFLLIGKGGDFRITSIKENSLYMAFDQSNIYADKRLIMLIKLFHEQMQGIGFELPEK